MLPPMESGGRELLASPRREASVAVAQHRGVQLPSTASASLATHREFRCSAPLPPWPRRRCVAENERAQLSRVDADVACHLGQAKPAVLGGTTGRVRSEHPCPRQLVTDARQSLRRSTSTHSSTVPSLTPESYTAESSCNGRRLVKANSKPAQPDRSGTRERALAHVDTGSLARTDEMDLRCRRRDADRCGLCASRTLRRRALTASPREFVGAEGNAVRKRMRTASFSAAVNGRSSPRVTSSTRRQRSQVVCRSPAENTASITTS
jgi:hypothetical protein